MKGVRFWSVTALLTVLAFLSFIIGGSGEFIEEPISTEVSIDKPAVFRCQHSSADIIRWRVNGSLISTRNADPDMHVDRDSSGREILRIIPRTVDVYVVVCVAQFDSGSPDVPSAIAYLTVTHNATGFIHEPQPVIVTSGGQAEFRCEHPFAEGYIWKIDGTPWRSLSLEVLQNIQIQESQRLLSVKALPEYNLTSVQCVATITDIILVDSFTATITVQGNLDDVKDLKKQNSTLSWSPPFSLDLTNVEPDIVYCVDVYNITCGGRELLISDCDVTETSYTSDVIAPDGYIYEYIVTPRSNVEGAVNGTPSQPLRDILPTFTESSTSLSVGNFGHDSNVRAYQTVLKYTPNQPVPSSYSLSLQSLDGLEDMDHVETTATIEPSVLTLEVVSGLPFRRLWNCTVLAYGCQGNIILNDVLTTHDFRDILSSSLHPGQVRLTGSFTDDTTATGVLVIVIGDSEVIYHKASRDGTDKIKETLITGLAGGEYSISVFVVEENGLPFERVATSPKLVAVETNDVVTPPSSSIEYSLQSTSTHVCITCTFLDSSATDCVAVVHQRISQLSSSRLMNIESSHKLTRSGDTASGCIEGVNMEDYQVGVVGGRQVMIVSAKSSCNVCVSVGSVTAVLVLLTLIVLVMIIFVCKSKPWKRTGNLRVHMWNGSPTTTNDHDTESGHGDEYEKYPLDNKEEVTVEMDSESTPPPLYSEVVSQIRVVTPSPVVESKEYDQVTGFKNPEGLHYAIVHPKTKPQKTPLDNDVRDRVMYSELMPQVSLDVVVDDSNEKDNHPQLAIDTPTPTPFTSSNLLSLLHPVVSKWKQLAEALSVDEDDIDEIFTNNETDEACLCDLLDRFITVHHNWVDVERALRKMGEEHLAERASQLYVLPNSVQPEMTDHLGTKVIVPNSVCQPEVESSKVFPTYCTEDNVNGNVSDNRSLNGTSTSVTGLTSKSADPGYESGHSSEEAGNGFYQQPFFEPATCSTDCCRLFFTQLGTDEPQQQNTENVQSEHDEGCYMSAVMPSLKVSHHLQMPKEEQQRLLRCKPDHQECLWQDKSSLVDQNMSVVNKAHHLHERSCSIKVSSEATLDSACVGQVWLPHLLESVVKLASNLPVQLSRLKMLIFMMSQEMYQLQAIKE